MTTRLTREVHGMGNYSRIGVDHRSCVPRCRISFSQRGLTVGKLGVAATTVTLHGRVGNSATSGCHRSNSRCSVGMHCTPRFHRSIRSVRGVLICGGTNRKVHVHSLNGMMRQVAPPAVRHGSHRHIVAMSTMIKGNTTVDSVMATTQGRLGRVSVPSSID